MSPQYLSFQYNPCPVVTFLACKMQGHFGPLLLSNLIHKTAILHLQFPLSPHVRLPCENEASVNECHSRLTLFPKSQVYTDINNNVSKEPCKKETADRGGGIVTEWYTNIETLILH